MRVIGAGWGRTGTTTAAAALEQLGFGPCVQMQTMWDRLDLAEVWNAHHAGRKADWKTVLADFNSCVDWPGCFEWREFSALWPDACILLTVRDADTWYDSVISTIHAWTAPGKDIQGPFSVAKLLATIWDEDFGGWERVLDRDHAIERYHSHLEAVRTKCPTDRLVEWNVADGWGPLCHALGVAMPDVPLPHLNKRDE